MGSLPEVKEAMKTAGVNYEAVVYPNCGHAFFNDTNPYAYNKEAADSAWQRTLAFLAEYLV
jgi:carboxymethylenebutenolidase